MAPVTPSADDSHQQLLDQLDLNLKARPFRNPDWRPSQRRNKNIKQIISEASRKEASVLATQNNSGSSTPVPQSSSIGTGAATPLPANGTLVHSNIAQAARNLSTMVLEKNLQASIPTGPIATYTNIESAPSLHPAHQKRYCDVTGLPALYTDPKTRLRYHNKEVFDLVRTFPQGVVENYLEVRGAHVVLKWTFEMRQSFTSRCGSTLGWSADCHFSNASRWIQMLIGEREFIKCGVLWPRKCAVIKVKHLPPNKHLSVPDSRRRSGLIVTIIDLCRLNRLPMNPWRE